ncbi:MAG: hypothetical protein ACJ71I_14735 [Nitrososphaeraceae archaeon]
MKEDPDDNNTAKLCFEKWAIWRTGLPRSSQLHRYVYRACQKT